MMYLLERENCIEDYYQTYEFVGVYSTREKADEYVERVSREALRENWRGYATFHEAQRLKEENAEEYDRLWSAYVELNHEKPKYRGDQRDRAALAAFHEEKRKWSDAVEDVRRVFAAFTVEKIEEPAAVYAVSVIDDMPEEKRHEVKNWRGEPDVYRVTEIEVDTP
jgi:hypothetical protein